ncbi:hypothetical protein [Arenimonas metalli]|uniref:Uncharacterized protein n=1 Tax=Arenimonas metalli CF5-1 TaxID=1384056 RepID=A0A091B2J4_9GAMM|nr:hypothetical protein [Arenimonas metalli]KFN45896.1 hypothetical protein N787_02810 [Arenimonas metalli CF5-1]
MPSDQVPLHPGESLHWHRGQATFHRGYDAAFAVSDQAAYLYVRGPWPRPRWRRIPLAGISGVRVSPARWWHGPGDALFWLLMMGGLAWMTATRWPLDRAGDGWVLLFAAAGMAWLARGLALALPGRTRLVLMYDGKRLAHTSYADTYADEKTYDREMMLGFAEALRTLGVPVSLE